LLLDEPTNHLDLYHQANLLSIIRKLAKEKQLIVIVAMHDLNLVSFIADKVALIVNKELEYIGTPQEVLRADYISAAYQTPVEIVKHPVTGAPIIFPLGFLEHGN
jgi:iron complex transport system ATP-binding protein